MCVFTLQDLKKQLENAEQLYQTQMEQCKKLEREKENLEKTSGVLCNEKENVDSKIQELTSELAAVREKASAMEALHKQKICTLEAEMTTLKKELDESVLRVGLTLFLWFSLSRFKQLIELCLMSVDSFVISLFVLVLVTG